MSRTSQKAERRLKKGGKKKLPTHVRASASQLQRMEGVIRTLLSPHAKNIKIYHLRSARKK